MLSLTRVLFYLFNIDHFKNISINEFISIILGGVIFDISATFILNIPYIFLQSIPFSFRYYKAYRIISKTVFIIINTLLMAANCLDFIYFKFSYKRTTADLFSLFTMGDDMSMEIPVYIKDFWYVFLIWFILIGLIIYLYSKVNEAAHTKHDLRFNLKHVLIFIIISLITIIGARGGFQLKPINIISANRFASANNIPLVLNTPFTIIKTYNQSSLEKVKYFKDDKELTELFNPVKTPTTVCGKMRKLNVVIIILESFSKEHICALNQDLTGFKNLRGLNYCLTPFLDSLIQHSLVFPNAFADAKRSIEGIPAVIAGLPTLMDMPFISSSYAGNKFTSLANILKPEGYLTSFYHGGSNGTMGFDNFTKAAGFDRYFGRTEYNNDKDYDGSWGIWDEQYLQYFANSLNKTSQPFFSVIFTLSSHNPYKIPEKYKDRFNKGNPLQRTISYTDFALKEFFRTASKMPWFDSTLFVFSADHTSQIINKDFDNRMGAYEIPIIYYQHNSNLRGYDSTITQQIDIMPSILDYLKYDKPYISFGNSVFNSQSSPRSTKREAPNTSFAISFLNGSYQVIDKDYVLIFDGKQFIALYDRKKDHTLKHNILNTNNDKADKLKLLTKAVIQTYNNYMNENKMKL